MPEDEFMNADGRFPATRGSIIAGVRSDNDAQRKLALERLCDAYWKPIYKYVRLRWQRDAADAQDLTQGFFAEILERDLLKRFDASKGRLRTYLRLCVDSYVLNEDKAARRQKRGGNVQHLALDFAAAEDEIMSGAIDPAAIASPESLEEFFEKEWVRTLFALAVEDLRTLCGDRDRNRAFEIFEAYDLDSDDEVSYAQLAEQYGMSTTDVTNQLAWARREFRMFALERLREVCLSDDEFERESNAIFGWNAG